MTETGARALLDGWPRLRSALAGLAALFIWASLSACKSGGGEPHVGGETNFLMQCSDDCGDALSCLCGTCTRACTGKNDCSDLAAEAECIPVPSTSAAGAANSCSQGATCEVTCLGHSDCVTLGPEYRCEAGFCRIGETVCPELHLPQGEQEREVDVGGVTRTYILHVPAGYTGEVAVPLVLDFHPMGIDASWQRDNSGFRELSDREGFVAVWPQGIDNTWDVGPCCSLSTPTDDIGFTLAIVRQLSTVACINLSQVYATGLSMGGMVAYYSACQHAEVIAAVAVSSVDLFADSELPCNPSRPVSEISFRGTADTVVPYGGGESSPPGQPDMVNTLLGATGTFEKWASINQCTGSPTARDSNGCSSYTSCKDATEVTLCTIEGSDQVLGDASLAYAMLKKHRIP